MDSDRETEVPQVLMLQQELQILLRIQVLVIMTVMSSRFDVTRMTNTIITTILLLSI